MFGNGDTLAENPLSQEISGFLDQLAYARGLSVHTRDAYASDLRIFEDFLVRNHVADINSVTRTHVSAFLEHEFKTGMADTTRSRRLVALKVFFSWLTDEGELSTNPTAALTRPKYRHNLPDTLTEGQITELLNAEKSDTAIGIRNRAMLELLYASGLRASELISLQLTDVHIAEAFLRCTGKGNKQRVVPIGASAINSIECYLKNARAELAGDSPVQTLFISKRGRGLCRETLWRIVANCAAKSGLAGKVHPHTLRHCFATHLLSHGANIRAIQEMLGHADIATTQIYTHVDPESILSIHRQFHPRP